MIIRLQETSKVSQRQTFNITADIKLRVFARNDCLMQIKAAGDVYELGDTSFHLRNLIPWVPQWPFDLILFIFILFQF